MNYFEETPPRGTVVREFEPKDVFRWMDAIKASHGVDDDRALALIQTAQQITALNQAVFFYDSLDKYALGFAEIFTRATDAMERIADRLEELDLPTEE